MSSIACWRRTLRPTLKLRSRHDQSTGTRVSGYAIRVVDLLRKLGLLGLLLIISGAPVMACTVPDAEMTNQERACCRMMHGDCGQMSMPASHSCCQKAPSSTHRPSLRAEAFALHPVICVVGSMLSLDLLPLHVTTEQWAQRPEYSPPKPPSSPISNLRV